MSTKERIIYEALNLFSTRGFDAISVRDIAKAVGIKASSLYNHFKNKQDIFDTIVNKYSKHVKKFLERITPDNAVSDPRLNNMKHISDELFFKKSIDMFKFYLEDEYMIKFRKLLTIEQFKNNKIANLYNELFIDDILNFQVKIFEVLMNSNILVKKDPYILALQFYSPVFLLFYKFENITDKERASLTNHISEFKDAYIMKG